MITEKKIIVPIYEYEIRVVIYDTWEELELKYPQVGSKEVKGTTIEFEDYAIVCLPPILNATVIHECEHLKNCLFTYIGYRPQSNNDEVDCYLIGYIYEQVISIIEKHIKSTMM